MKNLDKFRGCLVGGAVGDALGYPVEFLDDASIFARYGENGITSYDYNNGIAEISDDTQMTLFTATGLLLGTTRGMMRGVMGGYPGYIGYSYSDWYKTQTEKYPLSSTWNYSWLVNQPEMFVRRAPGSTCLSALRDSTFGTVENPINNSKGCGGVMRVAPIGLYFDDKSLSIEEIDMIGAEATAVTHGHSLGYIPAAALVHIIQRISHNDSLTVLEAVEDMKQAISVQFSKDKYLKEFLSIVDKAIALSQNADNDLEAIREIGQGWVAEEALAIAIYCSLKYPNDFEKAIVAAVNHSGDSDSTGSITGNIVGAYLGYDKIPDKFLSSLEIKQIVIDIADDLFNDCQMTEYGSYYDKIWADKYIHCNYKIDCNSFEK